MELPAGVLRPAQLGDWQRIAELEQQIFGTEAWPPEFVAAELAATEGPGADRRYWVVEAEGQVQGYSGIFLKVPRGGKHLSQKPKFRPWSGLGVGWGEVMNLALAERFRGQGWGRALLEALLAEARNVGVARVDLMVAVDATAAAGLYRSVGFKPVGLVRGYYQPSGRDAQQMRLTL